ncbi:MAG: BatD family protein [Muribaculaceae bacterium]|nr:BatD family protein [Muribaculaceae bacterium]
MKTVVAYILTVLCSIGAMAAPAGIRVTAAVDSAVVVMGDKTHLRVVVDIPNESASAVSLSELPLLTPGQEYLPWNGVDIVASDTTGTMADGRRRIEYDYTIQAFDPGTLSLPPFTVVQAGTDTAFSNIVSLKILPVEVDSLQELNPMASVVAPQSRWYDYIPTWLAWVLIIAAILGIAGVALWYFLRNRKIAIEERRNPTLPPYELAVNRLSSLRSRGLAESGQEKEFYTELTDILRQYLHGRFGINAMEMTSTQIVKALRANPDTRMTADQMRSVLSIADFVKFAKVRPLPDDNVRSFTRARDFVEDTKPAPAPEEQSDTTADASSSSNTSTPNRN